MRMCARVPVSADPYTPIHNKLKYMIPHTAAASDSTESRPTSIWLMMV